MPSVDYIPFLSWPGWLEGLIVLAAVYLPFVCLVAMFGIWWERKISAHIQSRLGPMRTGHWHGWAQSPADGLKLLLKEDLIPVEADGLLFRLAPYLNFVPAFAAFVVMPFSARFIFVDLSISVVFFFGILALEVLGVILAGWASNSKWALYGAMRQACQIVSYEIPLGLSLLVPALVVGTLSLGAIGTSQGGGLHDWLVFRNPFLFVAAFVFFIASLADCKRSPFDLPESESELVAGYHVEYSGMRFAFFFFAEYAVMYLVSGIAVLLFLGAWYDPFQIVWWLEKAGRVWWAAVAGAGVFILKSFVLVFVQMWLRWTLPRLRIDQVLHTCVKVLLPLACVNLIGAALWTWLVPQGWGQLAVQVLLTIVGTGGALFFPGVVVRALLLRPAGIVPTLLTPWNTEPPEQPVPAVEKASATGDA